MNSQLWAKHAQHLDWMTPWHTVQSGNFTEVNIRWFEGGELNVCVNCVDRHLPRHADKTALIWEADEPGQNQSLTFAQLHDCMNACVGLPMSSKHRASKKGIGYASIYR